MSVFFSFVVNSFVLIMLYMMISGTFLFSLTVDVLCDLLLLFFTEVLCECVEVETKYSSFVLVYLCSPVESVCECSYSIGWMFVVALTMMAHELPYRCFVDFRGY